MGIPYSKQINLAFDNVTPLVAAGFEVLQRTKHIIYLLAAIQVLTAIFLGLILITLLALIITVSPDLENERKILVTPVMKWLADWIVQYRRSVQVGFWVVIIGAVRGAAGGWYFTERRSVELEVEDAEGEMKTGDDAAS
ncbi:hypothetical protein LSUB1_G006865 [Lachnellula subtilissima]|uniref:Uncharacterized protein n=1 Tax=Lachnellula subtilissima TaxID=602034 RepID=A0A8H8RSF2_9HELO|nr:hypothetical protein LSUB1_G006865 [Lachnellula subtilissima]